MVTAAVGNYAGDVSPREAWALLEAEPDSVLIDVRTKAEWVYVGLPDLASLNKVLVLAEWQSWPDMSVAETFVADVEAGVGAGTDGKMRSLLFLCRSGMRSIAASEAMTAAGYEKCFNVTEGFEGGLDADRHRGVGGWKAEGLPWVQR